MTHQSSTQRRTQRRTERRTQTAPAMKQSFFGMPLWFSMAVVLGCLLTGGIITLNQGESGLPAVLLFVIPVLLCTVLVQPRGLFLLISSVPILYSAVSFGVGLLLVRQSSPNAGEISKTQIITAAYPLLQSFPLLAAVTGIAIVLAVLRLAILKRSVEKKFQRVHHNRLTDLQHEQQNQATARKARAQTERARRSPGADKQVTVQELMHQRRQARKQSAQPRSRGARTYAPHPSNPRPQPQPLPNEQAAKPSAPLKPMPQDKRRQRKEALNKDLYS